MTELALVAASVSLVWNVRMALQKKFVVILGFAFRLPYASAFHSRCSRLTSHSVIVLALLHLQTLQIALKSSNQTFDKIIPAVLKEMQLGWALISATIPALKQFVQALGSGYLVGGFERIRKTSKPDRRFESDVLPSFVHI